MTYKTPHKIYNSGTLSVKDNVDYGFVFKSDIEDLSAWLKAPKPFEGQIICWNESIEY